MTTRTPGASAQLAAFLANAAWEDIPATVVHEAKRSLVNYFSAQSPELIAKWRVLMDCTSSVAHPEVDFEAMANNAHIRHS